MAERAARRPGACQSGPLTVQVDHPAKPALTPATSDLPEENTVSDITPKADPGSPGGSASPGTGAGSRRVVEQLDEAASLELLSTGRIGRLIYNSRYGPVALPSEYKIHDGSIVFRTYRVTFTEEDLRTGIAHAEYQVVVEADQVDPDAHEGWVVLVRGTAHHVDTEAERASISTIGLQPWVEAEPEHFIRVVPISIAGQRLRPP
jgi:nitroimidazol reductase NimA-like FMN-containing flavoprotein (pyridoxamine 5'-phosphate oxidase superfamily)